MKKICISPHLFLSLSLSTLPPKMFSTVSNCPEENYSRVYQLLSTAYKQNNKALHKSLWIERVALLILVL